MKTHTTRMLLMIVAVAGVAATVVYAAEKWNGLVRTVEAPSTE